MTRDIEMRIAGCHFIGKQKIYGKLLLKVVSSASKKPCFFHKKEFFVRTNPATDKLEGQQLIEYISHHF